MIFLVYFWLPKQKISDRFFCSFDENFLIKDRADIHRLNFTDLFAQLYMC